MFSKIKGLDPPTGTVSTSNYAGMNGSYLNNAFIEKRNVVISFEMRGFDVELRRHDLYRVVKPSRYIKIYYSTKNISVYAEGIVETCEVENFEKLTSGQISILCPDPYFYDASGSSTLFMDASAQFEFPFSNESVTEPMIEFSIIRIDSRAIINYEGDSDTGLIITLHPVATVSDITLYNVTTKESMAIDTDKITAITGTAFAPGDDIIISTIKGDKYVRLLRNGFYTNIISALAKDADWLQITPGDNIFDFTTDSAETKTNLMVTFSYRKAYGGV